MNDELETGATPAPAATMAVDDFALNVYDHMTLYTLAEKTEILRRTMSLLKGEIDQAIHNLQALKGSL